MFGPSSRHAGAGSIYKRVTGLIKGGAIKYEDRPMWLDVYERFPPKMEPHVFRPMEITPVKPIFYEEDIIRAKFYKEYGSVGVIMMGPEDAICEQFIAEYQNLEKVGNIPEEELMQTTCENLKMKGVDIVELKKKVWRKAAAKSKVDPVEKFHIVDIFKTELATLEKDKSFDSIIDNVDMSELTDKSEKGDK